MKVAPARLGGQAPTQHCTETGSVALSTGTTNYTDNGLTTGTKYGFRLCAWDGFNASEEATIWEDTK